MRDTLRSHYLEKKSLRQIAREERCPRETVRKAPCCGATRRGAMSSPRQQWSTGWSMSALTIPTCMRSMRKHREGEEAVSFPFEQWLSGYFSFHSYSQAKDERE